MSDHRLPVPQVFWDLRIEAGDTEESLRRRYVVVKPTLWDKVLPGTEVYLDGGPKHGTFIAWPALSDEAESEKRRRRAKEQGLTISEASYRLTGESLGTAGWPIARWEGE